MRILPLLAAALFFAIPTIRAEHKIILPEHPDGKLLIFAHGYRPEGFPNPAILDEGSTYQAFLKKGWILAATSYRRNGMVVADGADDIDALRAKIEKEHGPIRRCLLHGESMGGTIVVLLAERDPEKYQGALAVSAAMDIFPEAAPARGPKIPLLYLSNQNEAQGPEEYVERFRKGGAPLAFWKVARDGHVNVNQAEVLAALEALDAAIDGGKLVDRDATVVPDPGPSRAIPKGGGIEVAVQEIDPIYGNIITGAQVADLKKLGIERGKTFTISVGDKVRNVFFGKQYDDVPVGEWVAFESADGWLRFSKNFRNAAKDLEATVGMKLQIAPRSSDAPVAPR